MQRNRPFLGVLRGARYVFGYALRKCRKTAVFTIKNCMKAGSSLEIQAVVQSCCKNKKQLQFKRTNCFTNFKVVGVTGLLLEIKFQLAIF